MIQPVVKWVKIFYKSITMALEVSIVPTMAGNPNLGSRNEAAGEGMKLEWQGLSGWCLSMETTLRSFQTAVVRMSTGPPSSYVENVGPLCGLVSQWLMWLFLTGPEKQDEHSTTEVTINPRIKQKFFSFLGISGLVCVLGRSRFLFFTRWIKDVKSVCQEPCHLGLLMLLLLQLGLE